MRSYTILRMWGIPIRINVSLLVFLPVLAWLIGGGGQIAAYAGIIESLTGVGFDVDALRAGSPVASAWSSPCSSPSSARRGPRAHRRARSPPFCDSPVYPRA